MIGRGTGGICPPGQGPYEKRPRPNKGAYEKGRVRVVLSRFRSGLTVVAAIAGVSMLAWSGTAVAQPGRLPHHLVRPPVVPANALVEVAPSPYGPVLVSGPGFSGGAGFALYMFSGDAFTPSALPPGTPPSVALSFECTSDNTTSRFSSSPSSGTPCTTPWPPLAVPAGTSPVAGPGVNPTALQVVPAGTYTTGQVEYYGHPLYRFVGDSAAGQFNGEDVAAFGGVFWLVSAAGLPEPGVPELGTELTASGVALRATLPNKGESRTLYQLTADVQGPSAEPSVGPPGELMPLGGPGGPAQSTCTGPCMAVWPPLLTTGRPNLGPGVDPRLVGELRRPDGTMQVTYAGWPVYLYYVDLAAGASAGETNGQYLLDFEAHGVWWEVAPQGGPQPGAAALATSALGGSTYVVGTSPSVPASGPSVVYTFTPSTPGGTCTGACARAWPPVLTSLPPSSTLSGLGTVHRPDGNFQVTYGGQPLYFFANILGKAPATSGLYPLTSPGAVVASPVSTPYGTFTAVTG